MQSIRNSALKVAEFLLQIKAVKLQPQEPFTWAGGWKSPIYCDNRVTLSYPTIRTHIRQKYVEAILENFGKPDIIAGVATGGIPQGALIAQELGLPFVYVRSSSKGHGLQNQVEGHLQPGQTAVVIEDLISTGKSSLQAIEALRGAGATIKGLAAIFTYGFEKAALAFEEANVPIVTLTNYTFLLEQALKSEYINQEQVKSLEQWRLSPETWGK